MRLLHMLHDGICSACGTIFAILPRWAWCPILASICAAVQMDDGDVDLDAQFSLLLVQVLGRNCRFLQGKGTDKQAVSDLRHAVQTGEETTVRILNYKKNGKPFWNMLTIAPMADADGATRFYIGVQVSLKKNSSNHSCPPYY